MISINNVQLCPWQVLSPFHTCSIDGKQLMVCDMIPGFSRGKLLTIESNWLSIL